MLGLLRQFGGYTYDTLMEEDIGLLRLLRIEALGSRERDELDGRLADQLARLGVQP